MKPSDLVIKSLVVRLGQLTLVFVGLLFIWDVFPKFFPFFPDRAHDLLGALPLALIAFTYLMYQVVRKPNLAQLLKAVLLAAAFFLWAANQFWPKSQRATLLNDLAIAFFVFDVFLGVIRWPRSSAAEINENF